VAGRWLWLIRLKKNRRIIFQIYSFVAFKSGLGRIGLCLKLFNLLLVPEFDLFLCCWLDSCKSELHLWSWLVQHLTLHRMQSWCQVEICPLNQLKSEVTFQWRCWLRSYSEEFWHDRISGDAFCTRCQRNQQNGSFYIVVVCSVSGHKVKLNCLHVHLSVSIAPVSYGVARVIVDCCIETLWGEATIVVVVVMQ